MVYIRDVLIEPWSFDSFAEDIDDTMTFEDWFFVVFKLCSPGSPTSYFFQEKIDSWYEYDDTKFTNTYEQHSPFYIAQGTGSVIFTDNDFR